MNSSKSFWNLLFGNYEEPSLDDKKDDDLSVFGLDKNEIETVKKDGYDSWNFDEEDLEEDDYYYEDDETSLYDDDDNDDEW